MKVLTQKSNSSLPSLEAVDNPVKGRKGNINLKLSVSSQSVVDTNPGLCIVVFTLQFR